MQASVWIMLVASVSCCHALHRENFQYQLIMERLMCGSWSMHYTFEVNCLVIYFVTLSTAALDAAAAVTPSGFQAHCGSLNPHWGPSVVPYCGSCCSYLCTMCTHASSATAFRQHTAQLHAYVGAINTHPLQPGSMIKPQFGCGLLTTVVSD